MLYEVITRYLLTIQKKAEDIQNLVTQMLTFSKMELEEYPLHLESLDLKALLEEFIAEVQPEFNTQGLSITAELCEAHAKVDRAAMKRILTNSYNFV